MVPAAGPASRHANQVFLAFTFLTSATGLIIAPALPPPSPAQVTAVIALVALAVFGGPSLWGLSVIMLFGILIGTYSSIYIAAPVILLWGVKRGGDDEAAEPLKPATVR